jgi:hypothetical protein
MSDEFEILKLKNRVKELETQIAFLYQHLGLSQGAAVNLPGDDPRIIELLRKGNLIEAIKIHRQLFDSDLVGAKKACEEMKQRLRL